MYTSSTKLFQSITPAAAAPTGYQISRSLRFNPSDSPYLTRTPGSATNRQKWTWSCWVKRSGLGTQQRFIDAYNGSNPVRTTITFTSGDQIEFDISDSGYDVITTTALYRDVGAWYHVVVALDSTQATAANRLIIYVNGVSQAYSGTVTQNRSGDINNNVAHYIGAYGTGAGSSNMNGYMTEINFIDGQQLTASSFGQTDSTTGVWNPIAYTGTYGTNGYYVNFSDNSGTTSTTLGKDYSGNGNNYTPNNFSVTAGAGNDSLVDSPTNYGTDTGVGGEVRGNYCTLNPTATQGTTTLTNGNLDIANAANSLCNGTAMVTSGKWYWEVKLISGSDYFVGAQRVNIQNIPANKFQVAGGAFYYSGNGNKYMNGDGGSAYGASYTTNDVIGIALNLDANTITFYKNNTSQGAITIVAGDWVPCSVTGGTACSYEYNFGQRAFAYTAPSGFKALCTQNLATPTIGASSTTLAGKYFNPVLYTGNGSTLNVTGVGFQPDWVWAKVRSTTGIHGLFDVVRGVTKVLSSDTTSAENTLSGVTAFNSDGFSLGADWNLNGGTFVAWNWKAGGTGVTNTSGSITSTVSANPTAGFSVVTYTGNGTNGATVGHGIGSAVQFIIVKQRGTGGGGDGNWLVGATAAIGWTGRLILNGTQGNEVNSTHWNNTAPTSNVFTLGTSGNVNGSTGNYVAYCFAPVTGFSQFTSFVGNGSTDGPFVYCGFRPRWILIKDIVGADTAAWLLYDTARSAYNVSQVILCPNLADADNTNSAWNIDILSNGFKMRSSYGQLNNNGSTYIVAAFAEAPFNYSRAR
jgi:hypothetical protein